MPEPALAPGETLHYRDEVRGTRIYVTDRRVILVKGSSYRDLSLRYIVSISVSKSYTRFASGIALAIAGLFLMPLLHLFPWLGLALLLIGIAIAIHGWRNRYLLTISWGSESLQLRDGREKLEKLLTKIREQLEKVRIER